MKTLLQVASWVEIVIGVLAIASGLGEQDFAAFVGGLMFAGAGVIALFYIKEKEAGK